MPYRRAYRRTKKRTPFKKPMRYQVADMAYKAWQGVKYIKSQINTEHKAYDTDGSLTINGTGYMINLNPIAIGDGYDQRGGISVKNLNLAMRSIVWGNSSSAQTFLRIVIFQQNQDNGSLPVIGDILETASIDSPKDWVKRFNSKFLYDKVVSFSDAGKEVQYIRKNFKLVGNHTNYIDSSTNIARGGLFMWVLSNTVTNGPSMDYYFRLTFTDD